MKSLSTLLAFGVMFSICLLSVLAPDSASDPNVMTMGLNPVGLIGAVGMGIQHFRPHITANATEINEAYLLRTLIPQLVNEYKNDQEDFLALLNGVPASAVGAEGIYKNRLIAAPEAVINNTVDFTGPVAHDKRHLFLPFDTVDTKPSKVTRSELRGLPYDVKAELRVRHMKAIKRKTRDKLLHNVAPASHTVDTPVIDLGSGGMTFSALLDVRERIVNMNMDPADFMVVMAPNHVTDLGNEQNTGNKFREVMFDEKRGNVKPFAGFPNIFEFGGLPMYDPYTFALRAFGSLTGRQATLVINIPEVIFHRETMKAYLKPEINDTRSADPGDEFRLGGFFAAGTLVNKGFFALV
ncbi:MAG: hypothetical protein Q8L89_03390 [Gammaproteobacteria bacterium]|nr:hypothetical protein [Gammaproteobacteria bacterium]